MWIIEKYKGWCQKQYDIWGSKLQDKYDFWDAYDNPKVREACQVIWAKMSPKLQKTIYDLIVETLKKYGPEFAKKLIQKLTEVFSNTPQPEK